MKFRYLYFLFAIAFIGANVMSFSSGPARSGLLDRTGSPVAGNNGNFCQDCHNGGSFDASVAIELLDGGTPVSSYVAGQTYTVRISVNAGAGTPSGYGFQSVIMNANNQSVGTYGTAPTGTGIQALSGRSYFEHRSRRTDNVFEIEWTAPAAGTGTLNIYAAGVATNANSNTTGDSPAKSSLELAESTGPVSTDNLFAEQVGITVLGNPIEDNLQLKMDSEMSFDGVFQLVAGNGKVVLNQNEKVANGTQYFRFDVSDLSTGLYYLRVANGEGQKVVPVMKR